MPVYYATADDLRDALGIDEDAMSDAAAESLIQDAEDAVDAMLGGRVVDTATGRRVVEAQVLSWQWERITRATIKIAQAIYGNPALTASGPRYRREKGPDFEMEDPLGGSVWGSTVDTLIEGSGLGAYTTSVGEGGVPLPSESQIVRTNSDSDPW